MIRILLYIITFGFGLSSIAQTTERCILVEQVTSASCAPCAETNPAFNDMLQNYNGEVAIIKYHYASENNTPFRDPMGARSREDVLDRAVSYYSLDAFPVTWINGLSTGNPKEVTPTSLQEAGAKPAYIELEVTSEVNAAGNSLDIMVKGKALKDFVSSDDATMNLHVVVVEREVAYKSAPGTNSEATFSYVMRDMLPHADGTVLGKQRKGQEFTESFTYPIDLTSMNARELMVVAFVQNYTTGEVHQAAKSSVPKSNVLASKDFSGTVTVYPTMASSNVTVSMEASKATAVSVAIYDASGREVIDLGNRNLNSVGVHKEQVSVNDLKKGVYYLVVIEGDRRSSHRFVISR